jgi:hypothetical protein
MTSSNFVGCWIGRSAGLAPFIVDVVGGAVEQVWQAGSVRHQAPRFGVLTEWTDRGQPTTLSERSYPPPFFESKGDVLYDHRLIVIGNRRSKCCFKLIGAASMPTDDLQAEHLTERRGRFDIPGMILWVTEDRHAGGTRDQLLHQLKKLRE